MGQSYFVWNDIDCRAMGVVMRGPAPIIRPEERVTHIEIPGRSGDLTQTEGENIYNSYIQTVTISVKGWSQVREVYKWLRGKGLVTFSGEPDRVQQARIIGAITLDRVSRNLDHWSGEVQFYCQPLKQRPYDEPETVSESGATVYNGGDVISRPLWRVKTGDNDTSITLSVTGDGGVMDSITVTGLSGGHTYLIDSDVMEVTNTSRSTSKTKNSSGIFPRLFPGTNTVTFSGLSSVKVTKKERFL